MEWLVDNAVLWVTMTTINMMACALSTNFLALFCPVIRPFHIPCLSLYNKHLYRHIRSNHTHCMTILSTKIKRGPLP
ncbi:MAG: hypothetical protein GFH27_549287n380 [Chloroflexi bacterium AL-W]|nr:hypothetical protein [Chloroflexi bacterium AL-N1]NOK66654.1 hypothetical protein [Chloroflexi bacterium AL-N10]NOK72042.1 hypothetical protein [Chloroflexi bacterium AL-N5]NOK81299.1 hypothetical protein [Chloroflexi bacterium AL-W]NOK89572.1 hypothetical protein [Chloroflexi bacterium AL-N15]